MPEIESDLGQRAEQGQGHDNERHSAGRQDEEELIFRLGETKGNHIIASLELVESAYRREVRGMGIEEFVVR